MESTAQDCAHKLIEVIPHVMQVIRGEVRRQRGRDLSILQLRALAFLQNNPGATLSVVADYVGLTLSSMSTQVSKLVHRRLIARAESATDRRFVTLTLTDAGHATLEAARLGAQMSMAAHCEQWTADERATMLRALTILQSHFSTVAKSKTVTKLETEK